MSAREPSGELARQEAIAAAARRRHAEGRSDLEAEPVPRPHMVSPLDAHEHAFRCRTCGTEFECDSGWATCPRDPHPPAPPGRRPAPPGRRPAPETYDDPVDGSITDPDRALDEMINLARWLTMTPDGAIGYGARARRLAVLALWLDGHHRVGGPLPTSWAVNLTTPRRRVDTVHLPDPDRGGGGGL